jgi:hypothetical protein
MVRLLLLTVVTGVVGYLVLLLKWRTVSVVLRDLAGVGLSLLFVLWVYRYQAE